VEGIHVKVTVEIRKPGWLPSRVPKWARPLVLVLTLAIGVPVVLANDRFIDVPGSSVHHDDVNGLASAGVTVGCGADVDGNPLFCPLANVTREQMASFLVRGLPRVAAGGWFNQATDPDAATTVTIETGIPSTAIASTGFLKIDATAWFTSTDSNPCRVMLGGSLSQNDVQVTEVPGAGGPISDMEANGEESIAMTYLVNVGSGTYELDLFASAYDGAEGCAAIVNGHVNVMYIPFDGTGNNDD
jgi:hypothetical protein